MKTTLELSTSEAQLLATHLARHLNRLDAELVRTDKYELQHALAREIEALRSVVSRLEAATKS
jgi:hypothetical protein